jgi:hypothetical protein
MYEVVKLKTQFQRILSSFEEYLEGDRKEGKQTYSDVLIAIYVDRSQYRKSKAKKDS